MGKHTPGPWVTREMDATFIEIDDASGNIQVGEAYNPADARLMAIAPELLEALKDACLTAAQYGDQPPAKWLSAIAKAEETE